MGNRCMGDGNMSVNADDDVAVGSGSSACLSSGGGSEGRIDFDPPSVSDSELLTTTSAYTPIANLASLGASISPSRAQSPTRTSASPVETLEWEFEGGEKMNVIASAVLCGVLYFTRGPAYPHPLPIFEFLHAKTGTSGCDVDSNGCNGSTSAGIGDVDENLTNRACGDESITLRQSTIPDLPPELYSVIASHLFHSSDDDVEEDERTLCRQTLVSCALVSSTWLSASRPYLFGSVTLTHANVSSFVELLQGPSSSIKRAVRVVKIREGEFMVDRWMDGVLPRLCRSLHAEGGSSLRVLDLYNLTWAELRPTSMETFRTAIRGVESLRVGTCYFECVHELAGFFCWSSSRLKHLVCDYVLLNCCGGGECECGQDDDGVGEDEEASRNAYPHLSPSPSTSSHYTDHYRGRASAPKPAPPRLLLPEMLESLYLSLPEESMLRWFANQQVVHRIRRLGVAVRDPALVDLVEVLVSNAGDVEDLVLSLPLGCSISLSSNTSLRTVHLRIPPLFFECPPLDRLVDAMEALHALVSSLSSCSTLQTLILDIDAIAFYKYPKCLWKHINRSTFVPLRDARVSGGSTGGSRDNKVHLVIILHHNSDALFNILEDRIWQSCDQLCPLDWTIEVRGVKTSPSTQTEYDEEEQEDEEAPWRREGVGEPWRTWLE